MDDLRAAIGLAQLARLESWNEQREALTHTYRTLMARHCPEVTIPFREARASAHHILPAILPEGTDRHRIMDEMRRAGIQTTIHYPPVHQLSWYREHFPCDSLPYTEQFGQQELTLPLHPRMDESQVEFVLHTLQRTLLGVPA
jgi:dTDP-4-amino-4,6-dideoxygalactose transaminase